MRRLADLLGLAIFAERWDQLVGAAGFDAMCAHADQLAPNTGGVWKDPRPFFRGRSGAGAAVLDPAELQRYHDRARTYATATRGCPGCRGTLAKTSGYVESIRAWVDIDWGAPRAVISAGRFVPRPGRLPGRNGSAGTACARPATLTPSTSAIWVQVAPAVRPRAYQQVLRGSQFGLSVERVGQFTQQQFDVIHPINLG